MKPHSVQFGASRRVLLLLLALSVHLSLAATNKQSQLAQANKVIGQDKTHLQSAASSAAARPESTNYDAAPARSATSSAASKVSAGEQISAADSAEKKLDESSSVAAAAASSAVQDPASIFSQEEFVQIKPEEVSETVKDLDSAGVEHKSAEDDLNAQLAQDTISQQESVYTAYKTLANGQPAAAPRSISAAPVDRSLYKQQPLRAPIPVHAGVAQRYPQGASRLPPSYITLKGKLTGINSLISQYPHPAPGYPHHLPRHLPRGAAAGYAAFRDFVRAHASKYKHQIPAYKQPVGGYEPAKEPRPVNQAGYAHKPAVGGYNQAAGNSYRAASKAKLSVAQAYIPHLAPAGGAESATGYGTGSVGAYTNPVLAKLYGNHAPQGVGKPEYSKDYGMVIHYPDATVYTEPMTVDQLHKLTGGGISQVIEQLQYNLAHGHRDESNTLRPNNKHHIGHGVTIHAKEYYAPGKSGYQVPTTAAVISTGKSNYESAESAAYEEPAYAGKQKLGSGYDRVKQAVEASQDKYRAQSGYRQAAGGYNNQPAAPAEYPQPAQGYEQGKYSTRPDPLTALTHLIGSELDSLYKANAAFTKQIEPEIHQQLHAFSKNPHSKRPLRYSEHHYKSPLNLQHYPEQSRPNSGHSKYSMRHPNSNRYDSGRKRGQRHYGANQQHANRPATQMHYQQRPQQNHHQQHQQQAYQAAEQALNQQMMDILHDFQTGDEQYGGKSQPLHATNQGYPHKVMQKYNNYPSQQHQQQPAGYAQHGLENLEIPQGPNDQIGEIHELIEALKGTLEPHKSEYSDSKQSPKAEDVRYLTSALGQAPSYAVQVPVANADAAPEAAKTHNDAYHQQSLDQQVSNYQQQAGNNYEHQQAASPAAYSGAQLQSSYGSAAGQNQPQADYSGQQSAHGAAQSSSYGPTQTGGQHSAEQQVQQVAGQSDYSNQQAAPASSGYGQQSNAGHGQHIVSGLYPQPAPALQQEQPASNGYSTIEHSQVTNHLVPVSAQPASASNGYEQTSSAAHQQPANQIAVAAPTESHYNNAQSLASFVDSLPQDYQELLRQPALIDGNSSIPHLAVPEHSAQVSSAAQSSSHPSGNQQTSSGYSSNASASSGSYEQGAASQTGNSHEQSHNSNGQQTYQQQQTAVKGHATSGQGQVDQYGSGSK